LATFAQRFQDEIRRLARKELKGELASLRGENVALRRTVSELRKRVDKLARTTKKVEKAAVELEVVKPEREEDDAVRARISGKTIRNLRARLGLTQADFARLVDVSPQSVYQWEREDRQLRLRKATKAAVVAAKGLGARAARAKLEEMGDS